MNGEKLRKMAAALLLSLMALVCDLVPVNR